MDSLPLFTSSCHSLSVSALAGCAAPPAVAAADAPASPTNTRRRCIRPLAPSRAISCGAAAVALRSAVASSPTALTCQASLQDTVQDTVQPAKPTMRTPAE